MESAAADFVCLCQRARVPPAPPHSWFSTPQIIPMLLLLLLTKMPNLAQG